MYQQSYSYKKRITTAFYSRAFISFNNDHCKMGRRHKMAQRPAGKQRRCTVAPAMVNRFSLGTGHYDARSALPLRTSAQFSNNAIR